MTRMQGLSDIPIPSASQKRIAEALAHAERAMQSIPATAVCDDPLIRNYADALQQARAQLFQTTGILAHLLERAAQCH